MPPSRLWWLVLPLYAAYAVPAALLTLMLRPFGFLKVPLMRLAYFLDGIVAWFERTFELVASLFVRRRYSMHRDYELIRWLGAWLEHLDCQQHEILKELHHGEIPPELVAKLEASKASRLALTAALAGFASTSAAPKEL